MGIAKIIKSMDRTSSVGAFRVILQVCMFVSEAFEVTCCVSISISLVLFISVNGCSRVTGKVSISVIDCFGLTYRVNTGFCYHQISFDCVLCKICQCRCIERLFVLRDEPGKGTKITRDQCQTIIALASCSTGQCRDTLTSRAEPQHRHLMTFLPTQIDQITFAGMG